MEVEARSEFSIDGYGVINHSGLSDTIITQDAGIREIASQLQTWVNNARTARGKTSLFNRNAFTPPDNVYDEMRAARTALYQDDIVSGVAEVTEAFAFQGLKWEGESADDADIFNQINRDLNLDKYMRQVWREEYACSQSVTALIWGWKEYTVRGLTAPDQLDPSAAADPNVPTQPPPRRPKGQRRKKKYRIYCPIAARVIDSSKVVPVGFGPLGSDMLAWCSTRGEVDYYSQAMAGKVIDPLMTQFFTGTFTPDPEEQRELVKLGVDVNNLLLMNPEMVFRHTTTKADYERFASVRLKSVFHLLDLKRNLIESDRATLIGSANYILLIRKGEKDAPAQQSEIANLQQNYNFIAKMPVIISDHRLNIDIIAPKTDFALNPDKYDVIDTRLLSRLLGTLTFSSRGQRNETNLTLSHAVARSMENRRHMLRRTLEDKIARAIVEHPHNAMIRDRGDFQSPPSLVFTPRNIALDIDPATIQALLGLRTQREISRETILEYFGLDQATEAQRLELEEIFYDPIFKTQIPFAATNPANSGGQDPNNQAPTPNGTPEAPQNSGRRGGRPIGGGNSPKNATKATPRTPQGNPSTRGN